MSKSGSQVVLPKTILKVSNLCTEKEKAQKRTAGNLNNEELKDKQDLIPTRTSNKFFDDDYFNTVEASEQKPVLKRKNTSPYQRMTRVAPKQKSERRVSAGRS